MNEGSIQRAKCRHPQRREGRHLEICLNSCLRELSLARPSPLSERLTTGPIDGEAFGFSQNCQRPLQRLQVRAAIFPAFLVVLVSTPTL